MFKREIIDSCQPGNENFSLLRLSREGPAGLGDNSFRALPATVLNGRPRLDEQQKSNADDLLREMHSLSCPHPRLLPKYCTSAIMSSTIQSLPVSKRPQRKVLSINENCPQKVCDGLVWRCSTPKLCCPAPLVMCHLHHPGRTLESVHCDPKPMAATQTDPSQPYVGVNRSTMDAFTRPFFSTFLRAAQEPGGHFWTLQLDLRENGGVGCRQRKGWFAAFRPGALPLFPTSAPCSGQSPYLIQLSCRLSPSPIDYPHVPAEVWRPRSVRKGRAEADESTDTYLYDEWSPHNCPFSCRFVDETCQCVYSSRGVLSAHSVIYPLQPKRDCA